MRTAKSFTTRKGKSMNFIDEALKGLSQLTSFAEPKDDIGCFFSKPPEAEEVEAGTYRVKVWESIIDYAIVVSGTDGYGKVITKDSIDKLVGELQKRLNEGKISDLEREVQPGYRFSDSGQILKVWGKPGAWQVQVTSA